jgi:hypothetical protein
MDDSSSFSLFTKYEFKFLNRILMVAAKHGVYFSRDAENSSSTRRMKSKPRKTLSLYHRRSNVKKLLITIALLTMIGTPAFAQSYSPEFGTANITSDVTSQDATSAFAQAVPTKGRTSQARNETQRNVGVLDGVPAGVDPYLYHENLMANEAN